MELKLPPLMVSLLDALARRRGISRSAYIRSAVAHMVQYELRGAREDPREWARLLATMPEGSAAVNQWAHEALYGDAGSSPPQSS